MSIAENVSAADGTDISPRRAPRRRRSRSAFRIDIQALRALAVMLVVLNHLWPNRLTGGYVGVDVFFVISGFLITSHLLNELTATGQLRLGAFYARRIRRLLPAAFLVLCVSLVAVLAWLPFSRWKDTAHEILASAFYAENWVLAGKAVDYSASTEAATVAQHYWSLSVEEQFYLFWPLLLLGLYRFGVRRRKPALNTVFTTLAIFTAVGLLGSVLVTARTPNQAYFVTHVRMWEFGAGALAAVLLGRLRIPSPAAQLLGFAGFMLIAASALAFDDGKAFPGWIALIPVVGTVLVILAGSDGRTPVFQGLLRSRPIQHLGGVSYSLYLWHWPMIVIAPFAFDRMLTTADKMLILLAAILAASLTKVLVEDRGQRSRLLNASSARTFVAMAAGMALIGVLAAVQLQAAQRMSTEAIRAAQSASEDPCYGPMALRPGADCPHRFGPSVAPVMTEASQYWKVPSECGSGREELMSGKKRTHLRCDFTKGRRGADVVWLVGDSHGEQWLAPVLAVAKSRGWVVKTAFLGGCPVADVRFKGYNGKANPAKAAACTDWARRVTAAVAEDRPLAVFTSMYARKQTIDDGSDRSVAEQFALGLDRTWSRWTATGAEVYVLADPPLNKPVRPSDCSILNAESPAACAVDRKVAQPTDPLTAAARRTSNNKVHLIDFTDYFCDARKCYSVVGGVTVYYDNDHLNREYSELLAPMLSAAID